MVHCHCEDRVPPCKAQIESGNYVTMSRNKVVKKLRDLDSLSQFLLEKVMHSFFDPYLFLYYKNLRVILTLFAIDCYFEQRRAAW